MKQAVLTQIPVFPQLYSLFKCNKSRGRTSGKLLDWVEFRACKCPGVTFMEEYNEIVELGHASHISYFWCFSCWFHWACSYFKGCFYTSVVKKPQTKAEKPLCCSAARTKRVHGAALCLEFTCVTWTASVTATGKFHQENPDPSLALPVAVQTLSLVPQRWSHTWRVSWEVKVGGRKPDLAWKEQISAPCAASLLGHSVAPTGFVSGGGLVPVGFCPAGSSQGVFWWIFRSWLSRSTQVCHKQKILWKSCPRQSCSLGGEVWNTSS